MGVEKVIKMSEKSRKFLMKNLPEVLEAIDPRDILGPLDDLIVQKGFITYDEGYNAFGREAQEVYDDIFYSNYDD